MCLVFGCFCLPLRMPIPIRQPLLVCSTNKKNWYGIDDNCDKDAENKRGLYKYLNKQFSKKKKRIFWYRKLFVCAHIYIIYISIYVYIVFSVYRAANINSLSMCRFSLNGMDMFSEAKEAINRFLVGAKENQWAQLKLAGESERNQWGDNRKCFKVNTGNFSLKSLLMKPAFVLLALHMGPGIWFLCVVSCHRRTQHTMFGFVPIYQQTSNTTSCWMTSMGEVSWELQEMN